LVAADKTPIIVILGPAYKEVSPTLLVLDYLPVSPPNTMTQAMAPTMSPLLDVVFVESDPDIVEVVIGGIELVVGVNRCKT
jgi:hypothetical protein